MSGIILLGIMSRSLLLPLTKWFTGFNTLYSWGSSYLFVTVVFHFNIYVLFYCLYLREFVCCNFVVQIFPNELFSFLFVPGSCHIRLFIPFTEIYFEIKLYENLGKLGTVSACQLFKDKCRILA